MIGAIDCLSCRVAEDQGVFLNRKRHYLTCLTKDNELFNVGCTNVLAGCEQRSGVEGGYHELTLWYLAVRIVLLSTCRSTVYSALFRRHADEKGKKVKSMMKTKIVSFVKTVNASVWFLILS